MNRQMVFAVVSVAVGSVCLSACGKPEVRDLGASVVHEESGIIGLDVEPSWLARRTLESGTLVGRFELPSLDSGRAFNRVGLSWDSIEAGGKSSFEVQVAGGAWLPVIVDFEELVPESGVTLHAGHVDVPSGASTVTPRVSLVRSASAEGLAMSPELTAMHLEVFDVASVAEGQEAIVPGSAPVRNAASSFSVASPPIVTRADWGARAPKCEGAAHTPYRMTFHNTDTINGESGATARARMRQMQVFHQDVRGWCDIGYHFSVDWAGQVYQGRDSTDLTASHVGGQNTGNIGVSLMGSFNGSVAPPAAQTAGLEAIFAYEAAKYGITVDADHVRGHQEWPGQTTSCPGTTLLAKKQEILDAVNLAMQGGSATPVDTRTTVIVDNNDSGFSASTNWWVSTNQPDRYGANYDVRYTGSISDEATWSATLGGGNYEVFIWYSQGTDRATAAPFFISYQGGKVQKDLNEQSGGGRWVSVGTYPFDSGTAARVALSCWTTTGTVVVADAVKFEPR